MARGKIGPLSVARLKPGDTLLDTEIARFGARCRTNGTTYFIKARAILAHSRRPEPVRVIAAKAVKVVSSHPTWTLKLSASSVAGKLAGTLSSAPPTWFS